jgi:hypothetical protein
MSLPGVTSFCYFNGPGRHILRNKLIACATFALACALTAPAQASKRGFVGNPIDATDLQAASRFDWYYNWDQQPPAGNAPSNVEDYIEYVPMAWGAHYDQQALVNYLLAHPRVKFILGFNEPNFKGQSNLTPSQAAAAWPSLQAIADRFNLKIVGPAINFSYVGGAVVENGVEYTDPVKWYDDFFAACKGCRVDHIAIHGYFNQPGYMPWMIGLFEKYNKPLWVTEFNQSPATTADAQAQYMREVVPLLENDPRVFRYAWFLARSTQASINLFADQAGVLTALGNVYATLPAADITGTPGPEDYAYVGKEGSTVHVDGTMDIAYGAFGNFRYLTGVTQDRGCNSATFGADPLYGTVKSCYVRYTPSGQSAQTIRAVKAIASRGVQAENTMDAGGGQNFGYIDAGDWMRYAPLTIANAGTYTFNFRVATPNSGQQLALADAVTGEVLSTVNLPNTGGWQNWGDASATVVLPAGSIQLKVIARTAGFNLNALSYTHAY